MLWVLNIRKALVPIWLYQLPHPNSKTLFGISVCQIKIEFWLAWQISLWQHIRLNMMDRSQINPRYSYLLILVLFLANTCIPSIYNFFNSMLIVFKWSIFCFFTKAFVTCLFSRRISYFLLHTNKIWEQQDAAQ